jgi:hypothetical protein
MEILQVMGLERVRWCETDLVRLWKSVEKWKEGAGQGVSEVQDEVKEVKEVEEVKEW